VKRKPVLALVLSLLAVGCAQQPRETVDDPRRVWQQRQQQLEALERWQAEGRLSVELADDGGQAHFTWRQMGENFQLRLSGPWGQGGSVIEGGPEGARLDAGDGQRYRGSDAQQLLAAVYGWQIPVDGLRYWLIGLPRAEGDPEIDRFGRLAAVTWQQWRIEYQGYQRVAGLELPERLRARRGDRGEIRLAIHDWILPERGRDVDEEAPEAESDIPLVGG
jgi:outer membrane lipoprotein LolB